ncbi:DUF7408 domain-containing protein [Guptibacillus algicola]|uniref:DUF7408 domain-containing protein n=1 Tax=Guptibacillus algicola TaxID=225844 RepID=UPI001CD6BF05|nr:hypothetical protein [Alkalihalobacillus algicola]MCA0989062.1 hypothetical protein [Alkalihalobacillus algicola]
MNYWKENEKGEEKVRNVHKTIAIILFLALAITLPQYANAAGGIEVESEIGIDGKAQIGKGFPVELTLKNKGEAVEGDLILSSSKGYSSAHNQVIPVELGEGEEKTYQLTVSGFGEHVQHSNNPTKKTEHIYFFEGGFEKGKQVELSGDLDLTPSFLPFDRLVVGVLSDDQDAFNAIKTASFNGNSHELIQMESVYNSSEALDVFDLILINEYNAAEFSEEQQQNIADWVKRGGNLVVGSSSGVEQRLSGLADLLPLTPSGTKSLQELSVLNSEEPLPLSNVDVVTGKLKDSASIEFEQNNFPLVVSDSLGMGKVIQLTYNPSSKELVEWDGNGKWWEKLIQATVDNGKNRYGSNEDMLQQLTYDSEMFPGSVISIPLLVVLFVIYLVVVVPVLYVILKKKDRREWGWWIIPSLALIASIGIYVVGAKDRLKGTQVNEMMVFELGESGEASGYGSSSILTNGSGNYSLSFEGDNLSVSPKIDHYYDDVDYSIFPMKEQTVDGEKITFQDVEYWSTRSATVTVPSIELGSLQADLKVDNGKLTGDITSELKQDLENVFLISGTKSYDLGSVKGGSKTDITVDGVQNTVMTAPSSYAAQKAFPNAHNMGSNENWKEFSILEFYLTNGLLNYQNPSPLLIGYVDESIIKAKINDKAPKRNSLNMIVMPVEVDTTMSGEFSINLSEIIPKITTLEGNGEYYAEPLENGENWVDLGNGKFEFSYQLPESLNKKEVAFHELSLTFDQSNGGSEVRIMDKEDGKVLEHQSEKITENVQNYVNDGKIVLQINKTSGMNGQFYVPRMSIKGEITSD